VNNGKSFLNELYEDDVNSLSEIFHENTKLRRHQIPEMAARVMKISRDPSTLKAMTLSFKSYRNVDRVELPAQFSAEGVQLEDAILRRRSVRSFDTSRPVRIEQVAKLLYYCSGITGQRSVGGGITLRVRAAPSGGGLYPIELYPCLLNIEGAANGIYHYNTREHSLELIKELEQSHPGLKPFSIYTPLDGPAAMFVMTAVFKRTTYKYSNRGYRLVLIEAGHIAQNIWLMATAMNLGAVGVFSFVDDEVNELLGVDGVNEAVIYVVSVGNRAGDAEPPAQENGHA
jgi:SagB-type dehydrogenase family enzyme